MNTKRLVRLALFTAVALIIHVVEAWIPLPLPIPGIKLGLANTVTLFMLFMPAEDSKASPVDVLTVLLLRILLGVLIAGRPIALIYSLTGGLLAVSAQFVMRRFVTEKQVWVCGATGAVFHNLGQILAAMLITGTPAIVVYLPVLVIAGIITGVFTGLVAQFALSRLRNVQ